MSIISMRPAGWGKAIGQDIEIRIGAYQRHNGESTHVGHIERVTAEDFASTKRPLVATPSRYHLGSAAEVDTGNLYAEFLRSLNLT